MLIRDIKLSRRFRQDMGDLQPLADSINEVGLLHPIVVDKGNRLIAGARRLRACRDLLKWQKIPATVIDLEKIVRGEAAENFVRKDFTLSEAVAIKQAVEPLIRAEAKQRQIRRPISSAKLAEQNKGETRDKIEIYTGIGRTTLEKAEAI